MDVQKNFIRLYKQEMLGKMPGAYFQDKSHYINLYQKIKWKDIKSTQESEEVAKETYRAVNQSTINIDEEKQKNNLKISSFKFNEFNENIYHRVKPYYIPLKQSKNNDKKIESLKQFSCIETISQNSSSAESQILQDDFSKFIPTSPLTEVNVQIILPQKLQRRRTFKDSLKIFQINELKRDENPCIDVFPTSKVKGLKLSVSCKKVQKSKTNINYQFNSTEIPEPKTNNSQIQTIHISRNTSTTESMFNVGHDRKQQKQSQLTSQKTKQNRILNNISKILGCGTSQQYRDLLNHSNKNNAQNLFANHFCQSHQNQKLPQQRKNPLYYHTPWSKNKIIGQNTSIQQSGKEKQNIFFTEKKPDISLKLERCNYFSEQNVVKPKILSVKKCNKKNRVIQNQFSNKIYFSNFTPPTKINFFDNAQRETSLSNTMGPTRNSFKQRVSSNKKQEKGSKSSEKRGIRVISKQKKQTINPILHLQIQTFKTLTKNKKELKITLKNQQNY